MVSLKDTIETKEASNAGWLEVEDKPIERYEAKYLVPVYLLPEIRNYIQPYVYADSHAVGGLPKYTVNTIQLDSHDLSLHYAKETEALNRFKIRIRTYGEDSFTAPVFFEIKRKLGSVVVKSRAQISNEDYCPDVVEHPSKSISFRSLKEEMNYLNFLRIKNEMGARPVLMIRYDRESYMGINDDYSRITMDSRLCYQMTHSYDFDVVKNRRWRPVDSCVGMRSDFPVFILECKSKKRIPAWFMDLVRTFDLNQVGFCKYSTALRLELLHHGHSFSSGSENCVPASRW